MSQSIQQGAQVYETIYLVMLGAFGLVFGSFANVVIYRFPRGESVVSPGSRCPGCGHDIRWYDNLPVLSWVLLRARCRDCGEPISARYPMVEALSGVLWVAAGVRFGVGAQAGAAIFLSYLLLILAFIDLDTMRLPNPLVLALYTGGLVFALIAEFGGVNVVPLVGLAARGPLSQPTVAALVGVALGAVPSLAIAGLYGALRGRAGLGMGDVKLLGAMGPFLSSYVLLAFFGGSLLGSLIGIPLMAAARKSGEKGAGGKMIPFGPFLALAGVLTVYGGPPLVSWYLGLVGLG